MKKITRKTNMNTGFFRKEPKMVEKITRTTNMNELLMKRPELAGFFLSSGMGCMGCPMARMESVEDGCRGHGMSEKEIDKFIEKINNNGDKKKK